MNGILDYIKKSGLLIIVLGALSLNVDAQKIGVPNFVEFYSDTTDSNKIEKKIKKFATRS